MSKNIYVEKLCIILLVIILCALLLSSCSSTAKKENEITNDIVEVDGCFQAYDLELDDYTITKRQTNKEEKTDYVWVELIGSNDDFEYVVKYELLYVLYNDGWLLEDYKLMDSSYEAISPFDSSEVELELSRDYDELTLINRNDETNNSTLTYTAVKHHKLYTTSYEINVVAEFEPSAWKVININPSESDRELNINGEWIYTDNDGRYYYMHVSNVSDNTATINYVFTNTSQTDEWNYVSSNGYQDINLKIYFSDFTGAHDDVLYFHLTNGDETPLGMGGDVNFGYLWLNETQFTDGTTGCGFTVNEKLLTRENNSNTPIIGMDETISQNMTVDVKIENMTDKERIIYLLNEGNIYDAITYIENLSEKSQEVESLEYEISVFNEMYGKYLGRWLKETSDDQEELSISCRYEDKLILCLALGETIEGKRRLFDLIDLDETYDVLVFHSNRIDSNTYHYIDCYSSGEVLSYNWETDDGLSTIGTDYIKIK